MLDDGAGGEGGGGRGGRAGVAATYKGVRMWVKELKKICTWLVVPKRRLYAKSKQI